MSTCTLFVNVDKSVLIRVMTVLRGQEEREGVTIIGGVPGGSVVDQRASLTGEESSEEREETWNSNTSRIARVMITKTTAMGVLVTMSWRAIDRENPREEVTVVHTGGTQGGKAPKPRGTQGLLC